MNTVDKMGDLATLEALISGEIEEFESDVKSVTSYSFAGCNNLKRLVLNEITKIPDYFLTSLASLEYVELGSVVTCSSGNGRLSPGKGTIHLPKCTSINGTGTVSCGKLILGGDYTTLYSSYPSSYNGKSITDTTKVYVPNEMIHKYLNSYEFKDVSGKLNPHYVITALSSLDASVDNVEAGEFTTATLRYHATGTGLYCGEAYDGQITIDSVMQLEIPANETGADVTRNLTATFQDIVIDGATYSMDLPYTHKSAAGTCLELRLNEKSLPVYEVESDADGMRKFGFRKINTGSMDSTSTIYQAITFVCHGGTIPIRIKLSGKRSSGNDRVVFYIRWVSSSSTDTITYKTFSSADIVEYDSNIDVSPGTRTISFGGVTRYNNSTASIDASIYIPETIPVQIVY